MFQMQFKLSRNLSAACLFTTSLQPGMLDHLGPIATIEKFVFFDRLCDEGQHTAPQDTFRRQRYSSTEI